MLRVLVVFFFSLPLFFCVRYQMSDVDILLFLQFFLFFSLPLFFRQMVMYILLFAFSPVVAVLNINIVQIAVLVICEGRSRLSYAYGGFT